MSADLPFFLRIAKGADAAPAGDGWWGHPPSDTTDYAALERKLARLQRPDRLLLVGWAAQCAAQVLTVFEAVRPNDPRVRHAVDVAFEYSNQLTDKRAVRAAVSDAIGAVERIAPTANVRRNAARTAAKSAQFACGSADQAIQAFVAARHAANAAVDRSGSARDDYFTALNKHKRAQQAMLPADLQKFAPLVGFVAP